MEDERRDPPVGAGRTRLAQPGNPAPADRGGREGEAHALLPLLPGPGRRVLRDRVRPDEGIGEREAGVKNDFFIFICDLCHPITILICDSSNYK